MGKQAVGLEYGCNRPLFRRDMGDILAIQPHGSAVRRQETAYHVKGRGLPASGGTKDAEQLALFQGKGQVPHHFPAVKVFFQMVKFKIHVAYLPSMLLNKPCLPLPAPPG